LNDSKWQKNGIGNPKPSGADYKSAPAVANHAGVDLQSTPLNNGSGIRGNHAAGLFFAHLNDSKWQKIGIGNPKPSGADYKLGVFGRNLFNINSSISNI
jgi:hypothetical protein